MPQSTYLQGASVWHGADMAKDDRWVKSIPAVALEQIDAALEQVKDQDWHTLNRDNFNLSAATAFLMRSAKSLRMVRAW